MRKKYLTEIINRTRKRDVKWLLKNTKKAIAIPFEAVTKRCIKGPLLASIAITYRCNQSCSYCALSHRAKDGIELTSECMRQIIDQLVELNVSSISFTGGEPLLREDILDLIRYIKKNDISTNLTSNGMLVTLGLSKNLVVSGLDSIGISLDSINREYVNKIRGTQRAFDAAVDAVKNIVEMKKKMHSNTPNVTISTVLTSKNCGEIEKLISFAKDLGANAISFGGVQTNFNISEKFGLDHFAEDKQRLTKAIQRIKNLRRADDFIDNSLQYLDHLEYYVANNYSNIKCYAGYHSIIIDCYGNIFPCFQFFESNKAIGHINKIADLKIFWYGSKYDRIRKDLLKCKECFFICQMEPNAIYNFIKFGQKTPSFQARG